MPYLLGAPSGSEVWTLPNEIATSVTSYRSIRNTWRSHPSGAARTKIRRSGSGEGIKEPISISSTLFSESLRSEPPIPKQASCRYKHPLAQVKIASEADRMRRSSVFNLREFSVVSFTDFPAFVPCQYRKEVDCALSPLLAITTEPIRSEYVEWKGSRKFSAFAKLTSAFLPAEYPLTEWHKGMKHTSPIPSDLGTPYILDGDTGSWGVECSLPPLSILGSISFVADSTDRLTVVIPGILHP